MLEGIYSSKLVDLGDLKKSVLEKAFTGKLQFFSFLLDFFFFFFYIYWGLFFSFCGFEAGSLLFFFSYSFDVFLGALGRFIGCVLFGCVIGFYCAFSPIISSLLLYVVLSLSSHLFTPRILMLLQLLQFSSFVK